MYDVALAYCINNVIIFYIFVAQIRWLIVINNS